MRLQTYTYRSFTISHDGHEFVARTTDIELEDEADLEIAGPTSDEVMSMIEELYVAMQAAEVAYADGQKIEYPAWYEAWLAHEGPMKPYARRDLSTTKCPLLTDLLEGSRKKTHFPQHSIYQLLDRIRSTCEAVDAQHLKPISMHLDMGNGLQLSCEENRIISIQYG